jgi:hypothetical protein
MICTSVVSAKAEADQSMAAPAIAPPILWNFMRDSPCLAMVSATRRW